MNHCTTPILAINLDARNLAILASRIDEVHHASQAAIKQGLLPSATTVADLRRIAAQHPIRAVQSLAVGIEVLAVQAAEAAKGTPHEVAVRGPINRIVEACLEIRSSSPGVTTPANRADKLDVVQPHREGRS